VLEAHPFGLVLVKADPVIHSHGPWSVFIGALLDMDAVEHVAHRMHCLAHLAGEYALGRSLDYRDMPTVRRIVREAAKDNYRFKSIVLGVVSSDAFNKREGL
jgi:hypothetical protein